jgi:hypothetical protein
MRSAVSDCGLAMTRTISALDGFGVIPLPDFEEARRTTPIGARTRALCRAGERLGDRLRDKSAVVRAEVISLERLPCAASAAFDGSLRAPVRFVVLERRMLFLELETKASRLRVLVDPSEPQTWKRTPWGSWFEFEHPRRTESLAPHTHSIEAALRTIGVGMETIDLAILTHLRGQDLRLMLGTSRGDGIEAKRASILPNAQWIIPRLEWEDANDPHELERPFRVRDVMDRVETARVVFADGDLAIGESTALISTPGVTDDHRTLFVRGEKGVFAWSSHGVTPSAWAPYHSSLPGLRAHVRQLSLDCVPRGDSSSRRDAHTSMALERSVVDRDADSPALPQIVPQQTLTRHWWALG